MEDKRRFPRLELPLAVVYYPKNQIMQFGYTTSKNVSGGGLCIPALSAIAKDGDIIKMEIEIDRKHCIPATGKVRWVKTLKDEEFHDEEIGIEFLDISPASIDMLTSVKRP
jgi:c-di-GMP-binding flagellar brake protein YcgR